jgi:hypothetical protein
MARNNKPGFFLRCWSGTARLWQAYWLVGVLGQLLVMLLLMLVGVLFWHSPRDNIWFNSVCVVVVLVWSVFSGVSIWRCAPNASQPAWGALARAILILSIAYGAFAVWQAL